MLTARMPRIDLFTLAEDNGAGLAAAHDDQLRALGPSRAARVVTFREHVEAKSGISINMRPWKMLMFLRRAQYPTMYEIAEERAVASGKSVESELRASQGVHYEPRVLFERSFEGGERFLYGALNIGGAGLLAYGVYCAFIGSIGSARAATLRAAIVPDNSLYTYVDWGPPASLREEPLRRDVGSWGARGPVAALKHGLDVTSGLGRDEWASMVCSKAGFIEVIFTGSVAPNELVEIRVTKRDVKRLADMALDDMMGTLSDEDRVELEEYTQCTDELTRLGLSARIVEVE